MQSIRIVSRGRSCGDFFLQEFYYESNLPFFKKKAPLCYTRDAWNINGDLYVACDSNQKSVFPAAIAPATAKEKTLEVLYGRSRYVLE